MLSCSWRRIPDTKRIGTKKHNNFIFVLQPFKGTDLAIFLSIKPQVRLNSLGEGGFFRKIFFGFS